MFDYETQLNVFKELYNDIIQLGDFRTRETETKTAEEYMKKKLRIGETIQILFFVS